MKEYKATVTFDQPQMGFIPVMAENDEMAWAKAKDIVKGFKNPEVLDVNLVESNPTETKDNVVPMIKKDTSE